jgi:predicted nucleic acid-binding protein
VEKKIIADTDVLIDYLDESKSRHDNTVIILENKNIIISISSITVMELIVGAVNKTH